MVFDKVSLEFLVTRFYHQFISIEIQVVYSFYIFHLHDKFAP